MYSTQQDSVDGQTINPAALASPGIANTSRGLKRSRSPEGYHDASHKGPLGAESDKPRKRGRPSKPLKSGSTIETPIQPPIVPPLPSMSTEHFSTNAQAQAYTENGSTHAPQAASVQRSHAPPPAQSSAASSTPAQVPAQVTQNLPSAKTPAKPALKALPTVRDHTTDQLGPGNDEYVPREIDEYGEKKVQPNGQLLGGRDYRCRTFLVPQRGDKLFMLATECARVLGYRDSYLLFNKNRSLFKIIANQIEKDDLVAQEILPFSYRSRQIAIVTARSMFRQFGSRVIVGGRRVRDDYWETKARKQGFTEADLAGEKRPGGTKAREAAVEAAVQSAPLVGQPHPEVVYSNTGQFGAGPPSHLVPPEYNESRSRDFISILKTGPRQEISGPAYQDRSQVAPIGEIHAQAHHAAEFNRSVTQQRDLRSDYMQSFWRRPHEQPQSPANLTPQQVPTSESISSSRTGTDAAHGAATASGSGMQPMVHHSPQMMMTAAPYSQPVTAQSSLPSSIHSMLGPQDRHLPSPNTLLTDPGPAGGLSQAQGYAYPQSTQMWPQTPQTPQYSYAHQSSGPSPHHHHHQQQQQQQPPPPSSQLRHSSSSSQGPQNSLPYSGLPGVSHNYPSQVPYDQTPRQYMHPSSSGSPAAAQGWQGQPQASSHWWTNQQQ